MMNRKNGYYQEMVVTLTADAILPGVMPRLRYLRGAGSRIAVASSSRNCGLILRRIGLAGFFDAVVGGEDIRNSKPDPEVFLLAASRLGVLPERCLVVEDAEAGVTAALAGKMKVLAVGFAAGDPRAHVRAPDLRAVKMKSVLANL